MSREYKIRTKNKNVFLRVKKGHFATMHCHTNYYIDVTTQKTRLSEAEAVAKEMVAAYRASTIVDTIICLDGTEVIGASIARELTADNFVNMNAHQTIYVAIDVWRNRQNYDEPLENPLPKLYHEKRDETTGKTALAAVDAIKYYGGIVVGISAIFATVEECDGHPVHSIFDPNDLGDYQSYKPHRCPICQRGEKIEALVNSYGYSAL